MATLAFDTLKAAKALREAGADERLAEAVVTTVGDAVGGDVATKADLAALRAEMKSELYRALWIQAGVIIGAVVALVKLLP